MNHFTDLCYNCIVILRSGGDEVYTNQSQRQVRKTGILRIRAMEQLRALFTVLSKRGSLREQACLGETLRKKIIETMLYMMRMYQFCSISHQQGILVLNYIREAFDEEDLQTMKNFVRDELESDTNFHYPSGKLTSRLNMGQICKIAFELRNFTQQALNDQDSSADEDETNESIEKRSELQSWFKFCSEKVDKIQKVWDRKLENPEPENEPVEAPKAEEEQDHEQIIEDMFTNFN